MPVIIELHKAVRIISSRINYHFTAFAGSYLCEELQNEGLGDIPGQIPHIQGSGLIVVHPKCLVAPSRELFNPMTYKCFELNLSDREGKVYIY